MLSRLRTATQTLASPPVLDFWRGQARRTWSRERTLARVVGRGPASADAVTLWLEPNRRWGGFAPGQHVNVTVEINGRRLTRAYSPLPVAGAPRRLALTVKAMPGGRVSAHLCHTLAVGDVVELGAPYGDMRAPEEAPGPALFLAAGSGITPLMAMTRQLAGRGLPDPVTLLYWARTRAELCFVDELRELARRHPDFTVRFVLTGEAAGAPDERTGRIDAVRLGDLAGLDNGARQVFACGPAGFVAAARAALGPGPHTFMAEAFSRPLPDAASHAPGTVRVELARSGRTLEISQGRPLLEALEEQGVKPAFGCRMGLCNSCACPKRAGTTRHLLTGDTDPEPTAALRLCVQAAASDLVIEL